MISTPHPYFSGDKIGKKKWARHVARLEERRGVYRVLVGIREGKRLHGRRKRRRDENIKMDVKEMGWGRHGLG